MRPVILCALLLLSACRDERPPTPSADQSDQLNEADAMLNAVANNEEGPTDRSAGPSNRSD